LRRCFFLHFGVAMGLHPLALQQGFRQAAAELLKYPENEMTIFFGATPVLADMRRLNSYC
jgi:hypothetical protein